MNGGVPNRAHDPRRKAEPTYTNLRTGKEEVVPEEHREWHARDPQAFASWKAYADSIDEASAAFQKAYKPHHDTFSWSNPDHYLNKK